MKSLQTYLLIASSTFPRVPDPFLIRSLIHNSAQASLIQLLMNSYTYSVSEKHPWQKECKLFLLLAQPCLWLAKDINLLSDCCSSCSIVNEEIEAFSNIPTPGELRDAKNKCVAVLQKNRFSNTASPRGSWFFSIVSGNVYLPDPSTFTVSMD